ncbi:hypothetical protein A9501_00545 [Haemophilus sp. CCUG 66565]|uniref:CHAT domain-containing protein n=1 Tax=Haemophilus haemolyticus TaxID=726 RepID=A0ABY2YN67_HAEHA|nr:MULTISPECIES: hypothetical protein [Haemophilus]OBX90034.1 hypothetical protein A9501_00545 [Haemophilus sp. CCUG 66565]TPH03211.1 hypothetical protein EUX50_07660 [Haemophilus haemolyticus]
MSKDFDQISKKTNYFFNIKYIIVHDDEYSYVDVLEKILNFPWDVREIFENSSDTIHNCIKQGVINPNYIFIHKRDTQKIEEEYNNHLFCLIIRMDNSHNLGEPKSRLIEFILRTQGKFYHTISELDIVNFDQVCKNFNINSWIIKRVHDFTKLISYKLIDINSLLSGKISHLNKKEQEILVKSMQLMEQFNQSNFNIIDNEKSVSLNDLFANKSLFSLSRPEIHEGLIFHLFEHKYYYYGKYSKDFELTKDVRKLAYSKFENQTIKDLKDRLLFPLFYARINNFLFFSLDYNINYIRQEVNIISTHCRNDGENRKSLSHLITSLDKKMKGYDGIISLIDFLKDKNVNFHLKLYSSLPIGWLNINGCPLALKHYYSLLPRHEYKLSMPKTLVMIKKEPLKILIIRSFDKNDPLKNLMENTLNIRPKSSEQISDKITQMINSNTDYLEESTNLRDFTDKISNLKDKDLYAIYRFVDVCSEDDLVSTLNQATESILIFDCHGKKIDDKGNYGLYLYGKAVNLNDLRDKIKKLPPIVIFSTCDSFPLNANQETSPAQSVINLGAYVSIGTYLPINGKQASIAIYRLIHRLQQYVDITINISGKVSFINVFQGWFIMEYVREVLFTMIDDNLTSKEIAFLKILLEINCLINPLQPNWFDKFLEVLKENIESFSTKDDVISYLSKNIALTDSMKYICVGFPEKVWISNNESEFNKDIYDVIQV